MAHKVAVIIDPSSCYIGVGAKQPGDRTQVEYIQELRTQSELSGAEFSTIEAYSPSQKHQKNITEKTNEAIQRELAKAQTNDNTLSLVVVTSTDHALETIASIKKSLHQDQKQTIKTASILAQGGVTYDRAPFNKIELSDPMVKTRNELEELTIPAQLISSEYSDRELYDQTVNRLEPSNVATIATLKLGKGQLYDSTHWNTINKTLEWLEKAITRNQAAA